MNDEENAWDRMRAAMAEAERTMAAADEQAATMGRILVGRLRHCSAYTLEQLKRELRKFNIHTGNWND